MILKGTVNIEIFESDDAIHHAVLQGPQIEEML